LAGGRRAGLGTDAWDELDDPSPRDRWTIRTILERVERLGDLFAAAQTDRQALPPL
jgi:bifunctional non-homologous end joining protein LigD